MSPNQPRDFLAQGLAELAQARRHLDYSFQQLAALPANVEAATESQLESVEAFFSRFARTVDILLNKVLRSLDRAEMLSQGTLLDVANRAEKRGFVTCAADLREMKDMRNIIAHDYAGAKISEALGYCLEQKPLLDAICERVVAYAQRIQ